jgi:hypothetical protein
MAQGEQVAEGMVETLLKTVVLILVAVEQEDTLEFLPRFLQV